MHLYIALECLLCAHTGEGHSVVCWEVLCKSQESNRVLCAHTQGTHIGGKSVVSGGVVGVMCTHIGGKCCVCGMGVVCTHNVHTGGECCVWRCGVGIVCTHKEC